jgi:hypothetical protein
MKAKRTTTSTGYEKVTDEGGIARAMRWAANKFNRTPSGGYHKPKKGKGYKRHEKHKGKIEDE